MNIMTKRIALFVMALVMALGSSLSTMDGGASITPSDLGDIPLMAWLFAVGAGISGALGNQQPKSTGERHPKSTRTE